MLILIGKIGNTKIKDLLSVVATEMKTLFVHIILLPNGDFFNKRSQPPGKLAVICSII